jgi:hypothetical protein
MMKCSGLYISVANESSMKFHRPSDLLVQTHMLIGASQVKRRRVRTMKDNRLKVEIAQRTLSDLGCGDHTEA